MQMCTLWLSDLVNAMQMCALWTLVTASFTVSVRTPARSLPSWRSPQSYGCWVVMLGEHDAFVGTAPVTLDSASMAASLALGARRMFGGARNFVVRSRLKHFAPSDE